MNPTDHNFEVHDETGLISRIRDCQDSTSPVRTTLRTDQRVIARVTDGIYRQPGSALRELISNAYDADATRVVIKTDAPRFDRISIEDNGHGMTPEVLAHLIHHIGGSSKRSETGRDLGVTSRDNALVSPGGRRLIGKIGIGLFSVSQLTHSFQIITKVKGDHYRTVAMVVLRQYSDPVDQSRPAGKEEFEAGKVQIWREKASDVDAHGTSIVLTNIRPQARDTLRSRDVWAAIEHNETLDNPDEKLPILPPKFHIGRVDSAGKILKTFGSKISTVPWETSDPPEIAFRRFVDCVWGEVEGGNNPNPKLDTIFDYYLQMIWHLSLSVPVDYFDSHIFDMDMSNDIRFFEISNLPKGSAKAIEPKKGQSARAYLGLTDSARATGEFNVYFDDLKLFRPIRFKDTPATDHVLKHPLVFIGKCREEFKKVQHEISGGPLSFEAYLFWSPKIAPVDHQGALIRIYGSSGTLFDSTFMKYQVSEQNRLRQTTCEIFVNEGLDSALNIDRESFNSAHPHVIYITRWLHSALRQLATAQKKIAGEARSLVRDESKEKALGELQRVALDVWTQESGDPDSVPPKIEITDGGRDPKITGDVYVFKKNAVIPSRDGRKTEKSQARDQVLLEKLKAITQVLASFGLLDQLNDPKKDKLLNAIYRILESPEE